ncbi:MAG TPA: 2-amino-4-hydroxy-6-hydroxymethyldihydropteridine diphosphokinase, partial [Candidatus Limnocylindria bacterium]
MTQVYLGLGSNLGTRAKNLSAARRRLRQKGVRILRQSRVIETEPWGVADQPLFLNQVVEAEWRGSPRQLLRVAKAVEREGGRVRTRRWGPRAIDVDILYFGNERVREQDLV